MAQDKVSLISIIVPVYNASKSIVRALESVVQQSISNWELIIIDDGSTDESFSVIEKYLNQKLLGSKFKIISQKNMGVASARNAGMRIAKGDYIAFLDADDKWKEKKLEKQLKIMEDCPEIGLVSSMLPITKKHTNRKIFDISFYALLFKNYFQPSCVLIRKNIVNNIGLFLEGRRYAEEGDYFLRIAYKCRCVLMTEYLSEYGFDSPGKLSNSLSRNINQMEMGELENFWGMLKLGYINIFLFIICVIYSIIKYLKRCLAKSIDCIRTLR